MSLATNRAGPASAAISPSIRFMGGEPTKPATKSVAGRLYISSGVPICSSRPSFMTAMRSPMVIASTWSWVTTIMVVPSRFWRLTSSARRMSRSAASSAASGSSRRNARGWRTIALAVATRWRSPPESWLGSLSSSASMPRIDEASTIRLSVSARSSFCLARLVRMFCRAVMWG